MVLYRINFKNGFGMMELIISIGIIVVLIVSASGLLPQLKKSSQQSNDYMQALMLAREGNEAVQTLRDSDYGNLQDGVFGIVQSSGKWALSGSLDQYGKFTRAITITSGGTDRKKVESKISWPSGNTTKNVLLTNWLVNWKLQAGGGDWSQPKESGFLNLLSNNDAKAIYVTSSKLYLITDGEGGNDFYIVDVANTSTPQLLSSIDIGEKGQDVYSNSSYSYLATGNQFREEQTVSVSDSLNPFVSGYLNLSDNQDALGITVRGNYAFISTDRRPSSGEFFILNISNPNSPVLVGSYEANVRVNKAAVSGNYAFLATDSDSRELIVINIVDLENPTYVSSLDLPSSSDANDVAVDGNNLYIATNNNSTGKEFYVVDIFDIAHPSILASLEYGSNINSISLLPSVYAFIGGDRSLSQMNIIDIANLPSLSIIGQYDAGDHVEDVFFANNIVYMATQNNSKELQFIQASD